MNVIDKLTRLDPVNDQHLRNYIRQLRLKQLKESTIDTKVWRIYTFLSWNHFKDAKCVTQEEIENYFIERREKYSPFTLQGDILELKLFFKWLMPEKEPIFFNNIKPKKARRYLPVDQLITREDISKLIEVCDKPRDRALIILMWDSGARIGEILNLNVGHVQFDRYGAVIIVNGKTGSRRLRLISSVPDLQLWLEMHPLRKDSNSPLFVTARKFGKDPRRLHIRTVENRLKYLAARSGMKKPIYPHAIRHARLTDLARGNGNRPGLNEMELRLVAGWERNSAMPEVYVHLSGADVERKLLANAGIVEVETPQSEMKLEPLRCPRCKSMNAHYAQYCARCSMILNEKAAMEIDESVEKAKASPEYTAILEALKIDLGIK